MGETFALLQVLLHQRRADALLLVFGQNGQRGEGQGGQRTVLGLDVDAAEEDVSDNLAVLLSDQRELRDKTGGVANGVHQARRSTARLLQGHAAKGAIKQDRPPGKLWAALPSYI